jgi:hypothetical protein
VAVVLVAEHVEREQKGSHERQQRKALPRHRGKENRGSFSPARATLMLRVINFGIFVVCFFNGTRLSSLNTTRAQFASTRFGSNTRQRFRHHAAPASLRI